MVAPSCKSRSTWAVVVSYNLRETPLLEPLRLTGPVLARIYLGQITNWDDPAITSLNPADELPNEKITVVHRSDGSGTTYIFTNYLSTISTQWASGPGTATSVKWPVGVGAKRSSGVAAVVEARPGSIGYFELSYAESNSLAYCLVQNSAGDFVGPMTRDVAAAAASKTDVSAANFSIVDEPGADSYPISGYSWVLLYARQLNATTGVAVVKLVDWLTHTGQAIAGANNYVPLPSNAASLAQSTLETVVGPAGHKLLAST
jgi:phosphate transport system substrate-binding protein